MKAVRRLLTLGIVLAGCQPLPAQEAGVEAKVIPAGNIPVSVRPGLLGDSGKSAADHQQPNLHCCDLVVHCCRRHELPEGSDSQHERNL